MLKHQKQGKDECALATIAMLSGKPLDLIRRRALGHSKAITWHEVVMSPDGRFWDTLGYLAKFYGLEKKIVLGPAVQAYGGEPQRPKQIYRHCPPKLKGTGQIIIQQRGSSHSVAFSDGIVYDSCADKPMKFADWWANLKPEYHQYWTTCETVVEDYVTFSLSGGKHDTTSDTRRD
jgi:hypothetical protein